MSKRKISNRYKHIYYNSLQTCDISRPKHHLYYLESLDFVANTITSRLYNLYFEM